jgi:RHS repeat-associated protein
LALERDGSNALLRRYVYGADLLSMNTGGGDYYFHHDALGSTANLTSSVGATQWSYVYEPYGTARTETKVNNKAPVSPMKFNGQYFDSATSLYHLRARQYDATIGRFLALDPVPAVTQKPVVSPYAYADARPTVLGDPSGNEPNRWGHLGFAVWEAFDASAMYGLAIGVGYGCAMAEGLSLGLAIALLGPPCAVGTLGPAGVGYWESRQSGSDFYDFLHPQALGRAMK